MATTLKPKTAKLAVAAIEVICPECGEGITNNYNGSYVWAAEDFAGIKLPKDRIITCTECGVKVKVPANPVFRTIKALDK